MPGREPPGLREIPRNRAVYRPARVPRMGSAFADGLPTRRIDLGGRLALPSVFLDRRRVVRVQHDQPDVCAHSAKRLRDSIGAHHLRTTGGAVEVQATWRADLGGWNDDITDVRGLLVAAAARLSPPCPLKCTTVGFRSRSSRSRSSGSAAHRVTKSNRSRRPLRFSSTWIECASSSRESRHVPGGLAARNRITCFFVATLACDGCFIGLLGDPAPSTTTRSVLEWGSHSLPCGSLQVRAATSGDRGGRRQPRTREAGARARPSSSRDSPRCSPPPYPSPRRCDRRTRDRVAELVLAALLAVAALPSSRFLHRACSPSPPPRSIGPPRSRSSPGCSPSLCPPPCRRPARLDSAELTPVVHREHARSTLIAWVVLLEVRPGRPATPTSRSPASRPWRWTAAWMVPRRGSGSSTRATSGPSPCRVKCYSKGGRRPVSDGAWSNFSRAGGCVAAVVAPVADVLLVELKLPSRTSRFPKAARSLE